MPRKSARRFRLASRANIERVAVELTESCNNNCLHCYNYWRTASPPRRQQELSRRDVLALIDKVRCDTPLSQVAISGGEPSLRGDLPEIVCDLTDAGLSTVVISNSVLLTDDVLDRFPEDSVFEVTLFSAEAELHDRIAGRPVFQRVIESLRRIERHRCYFVLALVINQLNAHDVKRTMELGIALGANAALLNRINLSHHTLPHAGELAPSAAMLRESLNAADEAAAQYGMMVAVSVPVPPCVVDPAQFPNLNFGWCPRGGENSYYTIGCTGKLRPCNHSSVELGDLFTQDFAELINSDTAKSFWGGVAPECADCTHPLRDQCRGGCPASAHECFGTTARIDPFVEFANRAGSGS